MWSLKSILAAAFPGYGQDQPIRLRWNCGMQLGGMIVGDMVVAASVLRFNGRCCRVALTKRRCVHMRSEN